MKVGKERNVQKLLYPGYKRNLGYKIGLKKICFNVPCTSIFLGWLLRTECSCMKRFICYQFNSIVPDVERCSVVMDIAALGEVVVSCPARWFMWFILCTLSMVVCRTVTEIVDVFRILIL